MGYTRNDGGDLVPSCDGWCESARNHTPADVTHVDEKGYGYCGPCGRQRSSSHRVRELTTHERDLVAAGKTIPSFDTPTEAPHVP